VSIETEDVDWRRIGKEAGVAFITHVEELGRYREQ
jgi:hypothetical protein